MLVAHFVTGANIATTSMIWCDSLCNRCEEPCPVSTSMGARSMLESSHAGDEIGRARPQRAQTAGRIAGEDARKPRP